ncbi:Fc.00g105210.m01.CDS01 [Cosmosporella sp. VM-42]
MRKDQTSFEAASGKAGLASQTTSRSLFVTDIPLDSNGRPKIRKLLIANRGEIACRVIETCRKLAVTSVAVYTEEDHLSRHIEDADEAICIGSVEKSDANPFLDIGLLIKTAISAGAQAIHPGYGYLSENSQFADSVRQAGLIFVGPSGEAMSTLGDKRSSKEYLRRQALDVPLIPGFSGASQEVSDLENAAKKIGFPVMLKASSGGGGKGMRIVREISKLRDELVRAQSEAQRSFGSSDCILEKFIESSKHVEVQIVGDQYGDAVSFFERDCSVQRRNQKVIEETPCSFLDEDTRRKMGETAVRIVKLIGYEGAGTVEFVLDTKTMNYYFLEVNTRLQVEHPITEEVVGVDLVALQLFVAAGGHLQNVPMLSRLKQTGHAIECRLCAEDPQRDFFPTNDRILFWQPARPGRTKGSVVRYETAIRSGAMISIYFDSMICKIVVWAPTRALAIDRMVTELAHTACIGIRTNQLFLQSCLLNPQFRDPGYNTSFISTNLTKLLQNPYVTDIPLTFSIIPSLYLRAVRQQERRKDCSGAFQGVRQRFYNQRHDPFAVDSEVLSWKSPSTDSTVCLLHPASNHKSDDSTVYIYELPYCKPHQDKVEKLPNVTLPGGSGILDQFKAISQSLRTGGVWQGPKYRASLSALRTGNQKDKSGQSKWSTTSIVDVSINGRKLRAYLAVSHGDNSPAHPRADKTARVFCHIPEFGDWLEFNRYTLLSYSTSQRKTEELVSGEDQKHVKAPMPCKILSILKSPGEEVNKGDSVMVIESMKMEITLSIDAGGKFRTLWKAGDAVNEGLELCSVD